MRPPGQEAFQEKSDLKIEDVDAGYPRRRDTHDKRAVNDRPLYHLEAALDSRMAG
jgi:hypothetical protein